MGPSNLVSMDFAPAGTVEIERNGMIHRGTYRTAAAIVAVTYGGQVRQMQMRRHTDAPYGIAQTHCGKWLGGCTKHLDSVCLVRPHFVWLLRMRPSGRGFRVFPEKRKSNFAQPCKLLSQPRGPTKRQLIFAGGGHVWSRKGATRPRSDHRLRPGPIGVGSNWLHNRIAVLTSFSKALGSSLRAFFAGQGEELHALLGHPGIEDPEREDRCGQRHQDGDDNGA
jgi:hypothetical protein